MKTDEILKQFEELTKHVNVAFMHDKADGFFINLSEKGCPPETRQWKGGVPEIIESKNHSIIEAMKKAVDYLKQ